MKNDMTTLLLNFVLAALVILGVVFALLSIRNTHNLRNLSAQVQARMQTTNLNLMRAQSMLNDAITYNATAKNPDMARIIQIAQSPAPAAK